MCGHSLEHDQLPGTKLLKKTNLPSKVNNPTNSKFDFYVIYIHMKGRMFYAYTVTFNEVGTTQMFPQCVESE